jgi:alkylation response protein AidB-like acyl-CoA dehydrogenase
MTISTTTANPPVLSDELIARCGERAAAYDRENRFFSEDWEEIRKTDFLKLSVPKDFGGLGMSVYEVSQELRRLAYRAPATALAANMHLYWTGIAAGLWHNGDKSLEWMLREAAAGEVFAAGHAESGNDLPGLLSTAKAERVDGGYKITGHKMFGSLSPVWTRFGTHAMDTSDPSNPKVIHAFMPRDTAGYTIKETWDTLGMRATKSDDTVLEGAFVPDRYIARILPAGAVDEFILTLFGVALSGIASVYYAIALRARDLAVEATKKKTSLAVTRSMAYHPEMQHSAAEMSLLLQAMGPQLDKVALDWSNGVDHGQEWPALIVGMKYNVVEGAKKVVDIAMEMSGGAGFFKTNELERLYRDVRAGGFHPANAQLTHEIVGKTTLGVGLDESPRWG